MKALILAAGFGQRLRPYTHVTPKPLFTVSGQPLLDVVIRQLSAAGISAITVNTHHLYRQIESHLVGQRYDVPVKTRHEPDILGTGGAIKNLVDFWDDEPFMVVNGDILFQTDLPAFIRFHRERDALASLLLCDNAEFNQVWVGGESQIIGFGRDNAPKAEPARALTFTGVQIIDPQLLEVIPDKVFSSVIDAYRAALSRKRLIQAYVPEQITWTDIGSPQRYRTAAIRSMADEVLAAEHPENNNAFTTVKLPGDGSDRHWYRLTTAQASVILADHGIRTASGTQEVDAFIQIGRHLHACGVKAPRILSADPFSGLVFIQDLGDWHLQDVVREQGPGSDRVQNLYRRFLGQLIDMGTVCHRRFDPDWTHQSPAYDYDLVLEKECRYFVTAFLNDYLNMATPFEDLLETFQSLAQRAAACRYRGFMHRDMQSRNIMVYQDACYVIDFQGARIGPLAYDLASLLIDPYAALPADLVAAFYAYYVQRLAASMELDRRRFRADYEICRLTRNLQILGAFGHLSHRKGKRQFAAYMPRALQTLSRNLRDHPDGQKMTDLRQIVDQAQARLDILSPG